MGSEDSFWPYLWKEEQTTCEEFTGERDLQDWGGYPDAMDQRRQACKDWLNARIDHLQANIDSSTTEENQAQDRKRRRDYLQSVVDGLTIYHYDSPKYPRDHGTDLEKCYIRERAYYRSGWVTRYDDQEARKQAQLDWCVTRRKWLYDCAQGEVEDQPPGWDVKHRRQRWENLCIATQHGDPWEDWQAGKYQTVDEREADKADDATKGGPSRSEALDWMAGHRGITEDPANSNCDGRSDGIRAAQDRCAGGGTWLRYQPWCGVWCFNALRAAGVEGLDSNMASVAWIESQAKAGQRPFGNWTTDGGNAEPGDLVVLFGTGTHVGMVREVHSDYVITEEGNTSVGSNGGSAKKQRSRHGDTYGYARVNYNP